jgi:inward rectifier potassium channel
VARRKPRRSTVLRGDFGLSKVGVARFDYKDPYHIAVSASWPAFVAALLGLWLAINLLFATLYALDPGGVANTRPDSFFDAFFFSVETLATVGYGVMAPTTLYTHIVSAAEIVTGTAFTAIVTGLLFVRFSRPRANIIFADNAVITAHNGHPKLMIRIVNARSTVMVSASARMFALLSEQTAEGQFFRRIHDVPLIQAQLPLFIMPWTLMHRIDRNSPLHGITPEALAGSDTRIFLTVTGHDRALATEVQDMGDYTAEHILFGQRYADSVTLDEKGNATADISLISALEPDT